MSSLLTKLNEYEKKAYHSLMAFGQLSLGEICQYNTLKYEEGQEAVKGLIEKGLASELKTGGGLTNRFIPKFPFFETSKQMLESLSRVKEIKATISTYFEDKTKEIKGQQQVKEKEVSEQLQTHITALSDKEQAFKTEVESFVSEFNQTLSSLDERFTIEVDTKSTKFMEGVHSKHSALKGVAEEKTNFNQQETLKSLSDKKSETLALNAQFLEKQQTSVLTEISSAFNGIQSVITTLKQQFQDLLSQTQDSISQNKDSLKILESSGDDSTSSSSITAPVQELQSQLTSIRSEINQSQEKFEKLFTDFILQRTESTQQNAEQSASELGTTLSSLKEKRSVLDTELQNTVIQSAMDFADSKTQETIDSITNNANEIQLSQNSTITGIKSDVDTQYSQARESVHSMIQNVETELIEKISDKFTTWKGSISGTFENVSNNANQHFEALDTSLSGLNTTLQNGLNELTEKASSLIDSTNSTHKTAFNEQMTSLQNEIATQMQNAKNIIDQGKETLSKYDKEINEEIIPTTSIIMKEFEDIRDNMKLDFKMEASNLLKSVKESINQQLDQFNNNIDQFVSKFSEKELTTYQDWSNQVQAHFSNISGTLQQIFTLEEPTQILSSLSQSMDNLQTEWIKKSQETLDGVVNEVKQDFQTLTATQQQMMTDQFTDINAQLSELRTTTLEQFQSLNNQVTPELTNIEDQISNQTNSIKQLLEDHQQSILEQVPAHLQGQLDNVISSIKTQGDALNSALNSFQELWTTTFSEISSNWKSAEQSSSEKQNSLFNDFESKIINNLDSWSSQQINLEEELLNQAKTHLQTLQNSMTELVTSTTTTIKSGYENILSQHESGLQTLQSSAVESFSNQEEQLLSETKKNLEQSIAEQHQNSSQEISTKVEQTFTGVQNQLNTYFNTITAVQDQLIKEHTSSIDEFKQNLSDMTINQIKELLQSLTDKSALIQKIHQDLSDNLKVFIETQSTLKTQIVQGVSDQFEIVLTGAADYANEMADIAAASEDVLNPRVSTLEELDNIVKNFKFPEVTSAPIIGWAAAVTSIDEMFDRVKSGITLLIPNPTNIPIEKIMATKNTRRITVASQFNLGNDKEKEVLKKLLEKGNVQLRHLEKGSFGGQATGYPPYLAADRDGEEVLFGSQDLENNTAFVGMVSYNRDFIDLMGKVVLSDFLSRAKKLDIRDF